MTDPSSLPVNAPRENHRGLLGAIALLCLAFFVYWPALQGPFLSDDELLISASRLVHSHDGLFKFWFTTQAQDYFPLTSTLWWIQWRLFGTDTTGYHVLSILLHAGSGILIWRILRDLRVPAAWVCAAIFVVHPVCVQSVAWMSELKNTLSWFLALGAIAGFLRFDRTHRPITFVHSLLHYALALLSKTAVVPLCILWLAIPWYRRGKIERREIVAALPAFALALSAALTGIWFQSHRAMAGEIVRADSFLSRVAIAGRAIGFYAGKTVFPYPLMFYYPKWNTGNVWAMALLPAILVLIVLWESRHLGRGFFLGILYYVAMLLPVLGFINIYWFKYALVSDHWQYEAIIGLIAPFVALGWYLLHRSKPAAVCVAAIVIATLAILARQQSYLYANSTDLWAQTVRLNPSSEPAHEIYGVALMKLNQNAGAQQQFLAAIDLDPSDIQPRIGLGTISLAAGQTDQAIEWYSSALAHMPQTADSETHAQPYQALGIAYEHKADPTAAEMEYHRALQLNPLDSVSLTNLGHLMLQQAKLDEAEKDFKAAIAADDESILAYENLGFLYIHQGRWTEAAEQFRQALRIDPTSRIAQQGLAAASH